MVAKVANVVYMQLRTVAWSRSGMATVSTCALCQRCLLTKISADSSNSSVCQTIRPPSSRQYSTPVKIHGHQNSAADGDNVTASVAGVSANDIRTPSNNVNDANSVNSVKSVNDVNSVNRFNDATSVNDVSVYCLNGVNSSNDVNGVNSANDVNGVNRSEIVNTDTDRKHSKKQRKKQMETQKKQSNEMMATTAKSAHQMTYEELFGAKRIRCPAAVKYCDLSLLSQQIWSFYLKNRQTKLLYNEKQAVRKRLEEDARRIVDPESRVMIIGSSLNGFGTKNCDLDCTLVVPKLQQDMDMVGDQVDMLHVLTDLQMEFDNSHTRFVEGQKLIGAARVPILQLNLFPPHQDVEVELGALNEVGIRNTHLLYHFAKWDWRVRPLVIIAKHWARCCGIKDASKKTLSSYNLELLMIYYLMCGIYPQVVPCFQQKFKTHFNTSLPLEHLCFDSLRLDQRNQPVLHFNTMDLGELFTGFLSFYSSHFNFRRDVPSIRCGVPLNKHALIARHRGDRSKLNRGWSFISVEEPFTQQNASYAVHDYDIALDIFRIFFESFHALTETGRLESICNDVFVT